MNEICTCPICFLPYDQAVPVVASCGHSLCRDCSTAIHEAIARPGSYRCPICERESNFPLPKNLELIHLLEFLQLQLDISTPQKISCLESNEVPKGLSEDILLQLEESVLYITKYRGIPVTMKSCLYSNKLQYDMEVVVLKRLRHPNIISLLAYSHNTSSTPEEQALLFEHTPMKLTSYFLSTTKSETIPSSLLTKEMRLKIAIDFLKAVLYIQSQRENIRQDLLTAFGMSMSLFLQGRETCSLSQHIFLDTHHTAKLMLMPTTAVTVSNIGDSSNIMYHNHCQHTPPNTEANAGMMTLGLGCDDTDDDSSEKSVKSMNYSQDLLEIKSIGYFLLELLFNQPMNSFIELLSHASVKDHNIFIQPDNPILSQYSSEGTYSEDQVNNLYTQPLYALALACLDINQTSVFSPLSSRQVLIKLLHIRQNLAAVASPAAILPPVPPASERTKTPSSKFKSSAKNCKHITIPPTTPTTRAVGKTAKKSTAPTATKEKPPLATSSSSLASSPLKSTNRSKKKTSHHPGYYHTKSYQVMEEGHAVLVPPSWRCCGKSSEKSMGCVYGTPSHHPGQWVRKSKSSNSREHQLLGEFNCCSSSSTFPQDQDGISSLGSEEEGKRSSSDCSSRSVGGCTAGLQPKPRRTEKFF